jgi:hypothetical protein
MHLPRHRARPVVAATVLVIASLGAAAARAGAQSRVVERYDFDDGRGKLISYYSAVLTFSPGRAPLAAAPGTVTAAIELSYVPPLSESQRRVGDKPEGTNLAPLFARPRAAVALPGGVQLEASWMPPVRVFDVEANVASGALSRPVRVRGELTLTPRVAATAGTVKGAITCYEDLARGTPDERVYYSFICNGSTSDDHYKPRHVMAELVAARPLGGAPLVPYAGLGLRRDQSRFDVGVVRPDGSRDPDHPILELRATRGYGFAGATWTMGRLLGASGELFYAPGSVLTVRLLASVRVYGR